MTAQENKLIELRYKWDMEDNAYTKWKEKKERKKKWEEEKEEIVQSKRPTKYSNSSSFFLFFLLSIPFFRFFRDSWFIRTAQSVHHTQIRTCSGLCITCSMFVTSRSGCLIVIYISLLTGRNCRTRYVVYKTMCIIFKYDSGTNLLTMKIHEAASSLLDH